MSLSLTIDYNECGCCCAQTRAGSALVDARVVLSRLPDGQRAHGRAGGQVFRRARLHAPAGAGAGGGVRHRGRCERGTVAAAGSAGVDGAAVVAPLDVVGRHERLRDHALELH